VDPFNVAVVVIAGDAPTGVISCCWDSVDKGIFGTGEVVAGNGEVEDAILTALGLLQLAASIISAAGVGEVEGKPYSPLALFSLLSGILLGLDVEFKLGEEFSLSISSSNFDLEFSGLIKDGLEVMWTSVDGVSKCCNGLVLPGAVLVGDISPLLSTVLEVGERLMVFVFI